MTMFRFFTLLEIFIDWLILFFMQMQTMQIQPYKIRLYRNNMKMEYCVMLANI